MLRTVDSRVDKLPIFCSQTKHTYLGTFMCWAAALWRFVLEFIVAV